MAEKDKEKEKKEISDEDKERHKEIERRRIRAEKLDKMKADIREMITRAFRDAGIPVDHQGRFFIDGAFTVEERIRPNFTDIDLILAKLILVEDRISGIENILNKYDKRK